MRSVYDIREHFFILSTFAKDEAIFKASSFYEENYLKFGKCEAEKSGAYMVYVSIFSY